MCEAPQFLRTIYKEKLWKWGKTEEMNLLRSSTTFKLATCEGQTNKHPLRLTEQWCNAFGDDVGHTERQQQDTDDRSSQSSQDEIEVDVSDTVSIHLQQQEGGYQYFDFTIPTQTQLFFLKLF